MVVCPGSRSAAIAAAVADSNLDGHAIYDERSAAFFALGLSRVNRRPTALICTSGTAGAHFYPALIEASMSGIPLVVITADRPIEAQNAGASQTIDQTHMFGRHVRSYVDIGNPCADARGQRAAWNKLCRAIAISRGPIPGPVHINAPFRKPILAPTPLIESMANIHQPVPMPVCGPEVIDDMTTAIASAERPVIVCGPSAPEPSPPLSETTTIPHTFSQRAIFMLAQIARMPVLAEATSQLRFVAASNDSNPIAIIEHFDEIFRRSLSSDLIPDLIIECGTPPTSSGYARFLENHDNSPIKRIAIRPLRYQDPSHNATQVVVGPIGSIVTQLCESMTSHPQTKKPITNAMADSREAFRQRWRMMNAAINHAASLAAESAEPKSSGQAAIQAIVANLPAGTQLVIGNSLAIRWLNAMPSRPHASSHKTPVPLALSVYSQRGAAGIDGMIASAAGIALASQRPTCLIIGDVSAAHDLGSLALTNPISTPLIICVLDNRGGQIFSELPYAKYLPQKTLNKFFTTPPNVNFGAAAAAFGVTTTITDTLTSLATTITAATQHNGATLIRIPIQTRSRPVLSTPQQGSSA